VALAVNPATGRACKKTESQRGEKVYEWEKGEASYKTFGSGEEEPEQPYPILETRTVMRKIYDDSHTGDYMRSLATTTSGSLIKGWT